MSRINAIRIVNLNYNKNGSHIDDIKFDMNGINTLLSWKNGGGKSVLTQLIMSLFVKNRLKRKGNGGRLFSDLFLPNSPTFISVEWVLDGGAGYVLTGMMARKKPDVPEGVEMVNFISEYKKGNELDANKLDIDHIPVVRQTENRKKLESFSTWKKAFETYKKENSPDFACHEMSIESRRNSYFERLKDYQIDHTEWEDIIWKLNQKESGLSEYFVKGTGNNAKTMSVRELVEEHFLDAADKKLNNETNQIGNFCESLQKYADSYRQNKSSIQQEKEIREFQSMEPELSTEIKNCKDAKEKLDDGEEQVIAFLRGLQEAGNQAERRIQELDEAKMEVDRERKQTEYEQVSMEYYAAADKIAAATQRKEEAEERKNELDTALSGLERQIQIQDLARHSEKTASFRKDMLEEKERFDAINKEESTDERNAIGYALKTGYGKLKENQEEKIKTYHSMREELARQMQNSTSVLKKYQQESPSLREEKGKMNTEVNRFDRTEEQFNSRYGESLSRNLFKEYETGLLDKYQERYKKEREQTEKELGVCKGKIDSGEEKEKALSDEISENKRELQETTYALKDAGRDLATYDRQLEERKRILRIFGIQGQDLFDTGHIIPLCEQKIFSIQAIRDQLRDEMNELKKERKKLETNPSMELSPELKEALKIAGVDYCYGMEWLQKNGKGIEENKKVIDSHPFLPYALIVSESDLQKIKSCDVFTSLPVPIIIRKDLETELSHTEGPVYGYGHVNFYMFFNRDLLDKEKLSQMIAEKSRQIKDKEENCQIRDKELERYKDSLSSLRRQDLTAEQYDMAKTRVYSLQNTKAAIEKELPDKEEQLEQIKEGQGKLLRLKEELRTVSQTQVQRQEAFVSLREAYMQYLKTKGSLNVCMNRLSEIDAQTGNEEEKLSLLQKQWDALVHTGDKLEEEMKELQKKCAIYGEFEPVSWAAELPEDINILESRFKAIEDNYTKDFEERLRAYKRALKYFNDEVEELHKLEEKYGLYSEAYAGISYDEREKDLLQDQASGTKKKIEKELKIIRKEENEIKQQQWEQGKQLEKIKEQFQNEAPIPRNEVTDMNFSERLSELKERSGWLETQKKEMRSRSEKYKSVLWNMHKYEDMDKGQDIDGKVDVTLIELKSIDSYAERVKENLEKSRREYDHASASMETLLGKIKEQCKGSDYTSQTVDSLLALADNIQGLEEQLAVISESYKVQLKVLDINLKHVEEEKGAIVMQLTAYIQSVLENLEKIDDHSTIQVGGKMRKMLQIKSPGWNENETIYKGRVQSFVDAMTNNLMAELEAGRNAGEYCRLNVNTVELFDAVIGINNIDVRIYKVEENGIRPMSWNEVSKNSGGERFLSSFIVLSSLLCYMRSGIYESAGLGSNNKESKVLLMDNPFGVITSEHLLKPLMEMAQKTNTQLICLSDAKGESIYGRFDNIYAMSQYESRLRPGMIIDAERIKGESIKSIEAAQVEVYDQLSFNF